MSFRHSLESLFISFLGNQIFEMLYLLSYVLFPLSCNFCSVWSTVNRVSLKSQPEGHYILKHSFTKQRANSVDG